MSGPMRCDKCDRFIEDADEFRIYHAPCVVDGQDRLDGEALRRLRGALPEKDAFSMWSEFGGRWLVTHYPYSGGHTIHDGPTIAAAADACREALEAQR